jgi:deoxycytidine triphosphate deaminase
VGQLSDRELRGLLPEMNFRVPHYATPFSDDQVQPASIDLRVDRVYWKKQWVFRFPIDLSSKFRASILTRRPMYQTDTGSRGKFKLAPGAVVMGRTLEEFTIPNGYAAEIFTRSSFARLGILATFGGYINPGYRGHMPLQIKNLGEHTIVLPPMISICQLVLRQLTSPAEHPYGPEVDARSKYADDDGGPSRWEMDAIISANQQALGSANVPEEEQNKVLPVLLRCDLSTQLRFDKFLSRAKEADLQNADVILDAFAQKEKAFRFFYGLFSGSVAAALLLDGASIGSVFGLPVGETTYGWIHYTLWAASAVVTIIALRMAWLRLTARETDFLLPEDLAAIRSGQRE